LAKVKKTAAASSDDAHDLPGDFEIDAAQWKSSEGNFLTRV
jgi:hypothetical protein